MICTFHFVWVRDVQHCAICERQLHALNWEDGRIGQATIEACRKQPLVEDASLAVQGSVTRTNHSRHPIESKDECTQAAQLPAQQEWHHSWVWVMLHINRSCTEKLLWQLQYLDAASVLKCLLQSHSAGLSSIEAVRLTQMMTARKTVEPFIIVLRIAARAHCAGWSYALPCDWQIRCVL